MSYPFSFLRAVRRSWQILCISALILTCVVFLGVFFFLHGQSLMKSQLEEKLRNTAAMAAMQFNAPAISRIKGRQSMDTPEFRDIVSRLRRIRGEIPEIRFAYIMRQTENPDELEFVADADSLATPQELDRNMNGIVDTNEEGSYPGDSYDITDIPALRGQAFQAPSVDPEFTHDQWGTLMSAYAPVRDKSGRPVAILGIDMNADDFLALTRSIFSPVAFLLLVIAGSMLTMLIAIFLWRRRSETFRRIEAERSGLMLLTFHQIGGPLTIFRWSTEALLEAAKHGCEPLQQAVEEYADDMQTGVARLAGILDVLKEASLVEAGTLAYTRQTVPLSGIVDSSVWQLQNDLQSHEQRVDAHVPRDISVTVDPVLIGGVLRELLQNAITFSPKKCVISLTAKRNRNMVTVDIRDTGCGIDTHDLPRLFQKFARGTNAHLHRTDGSGLGLYIAKGIIERAGGEIWMKSKIGEGTTVTFTLPC